MATKGTTKSASKTRSKKRSYIFVVGGVMSGVGKGVASSSIAKILQARGLTVTALKIDPYINVDAGTMNPTEHGEVFVLQGGLETDQDMGNYERFIGVDIPDINYMTTGSVYQTVIQKERNLEYKGKNVQVVPDVPLEVIRRIKHAAEVADADVTITEIGGTIGEYENILFLEAVRMMKGEMPGSVAVVMVSYLPVPGSLGEMKTKPTQHASRTLNSAGVFADFILARAPIAVDKKRKEKIARFCNVQPDHVISAPDVKSIYDVPLNFERDKLSERICSVLNLPCKKSNLSTWKRFVDRSKDTHDTVQIAVVGKYFSSGDFVLSDVYISILEAIKYSAYKLGLKPEITYLSSQDFENKKNLQKLKKFDGVLIPGGFGTTGIQGKLNVIQYVRENKIPYFGICYGMQLAVVEFAQNVLKLKQVSTAEIDPTAKHVVVDIMPEQKEKLAKKDMGGTMRLGEYPAVLAKGSIAAKAYGATTISERHRHRYEVSPDYITEISSGGLIFSGTSPDGRLMEIAELPPSKHPFFLGVQFHPEFHARPLDPHPLFTAFIKASYESK
ncbi:CTP synthase [Candidatus Parcubacteria bacterium]|uniref:CTP synthase n=1 Tax=Candidatus Kaiserbacteria bacterium CG10_big_fil_rev_8_21_14_0_10_47_16 TaxID=1974608 RepID=A0A2H0UD56_9BACT|nr:CTP synthase [Candidatus Parcubacteria bacterium]PIR84358.1 MAG: CTP synthase [Candidatus Kaiserbacteria bacterium CG10_big_fil_rev_8_21_14_0_10_47_16]